MNDVQTQGGEWILIFHSLHRIMKAERRLVEEAIDGFRVIPTPRTLHSACGLSLRVNGEDNCNRIETFLAREGIAVREKHQRTSAGYQAVALHDTTQTLLAANA